MSLRGLLLSLVIILGFVPATLADTIRVRLPQGDDSARYSGSIRGFDSDTYIIDARRGQTLVLNLRSSNRFAFYNILPPGSDSAIYIGSIEGNSSSTVLPSG